MRSGKYRQDELNLGKCGDANGATQAAREQDLYEESAVAVLAYFAGHNASIRNYQKVPVVLQEEDSSVCQPNVSAGRDNRCQY